MYREGEKRNVDCVGEVVILVFIPLAFQMLSPVFLDFTLCLSAPFLTEKNPVTQPLKAS